MNLAFKRELEMAEYDALIGDAEKFFDREERLIAMDIHGDTLQLNHLNKCKLIASFRTDRIVTAKEVWQKLNVSMNRSEIHEMWSQVWSVPESSTSGYKEMVYAIMEDPTSAAGSVAKKVAMVTMLILLVLGGGGGIWWMVDRDGVAATPPGTGSDVLKVDTQKAEEVAPTELSIGDIYTAQELFKKASPSVVMFVGVADWQLPDGRTFKQALGHGSGFIIESQGLVPEGSRLVMTNRHVSEMFPSSEHIETYEKDDIYLRSILFYAIIRDPSPRAIIANPIFNSRRNDVALIQLDNVNLPLLELATSNSNIGEEVIVVGYRAASMDAHQSENAIDEDEAAWKLSSSDISALIDMFSPNKDFLPTLSPGAISGILSHTTDDGHTYDVIETSAMAGPGNSGGPMLNMYNKVVGVLTKGDGNKIDSEGNVVHVGHSAVNLCIGVEEINKVLEEWRSTQQ